MRLLEIIAPGHFQLTRDVIQNQPYAILSHTWGRDEDEVTLRDLENNSGHQKPGYRKLQLCADQAQRSGLKYFWVDTCCIDKSSSAELSEAINSMFRWYQRSAECYAFLEDLHASASLDKALPSCRWFTRGWTLQELIAPEQVLFFDRDWNLRGNKKDLAQDISRITGISVGILQHEVHLSSVAVAQRMSWASRRRTTRVEDVAYCLLGIFDVNMPLLYGEEEKAFRRLQEEIIKSTPDFSLFAWTMPLTPGVSQDMHPRSICGVLAQRPIYFAECGSLTRAPSFIGSEFSVSNTGVKTQVQILSENIHGSRGLRYILPLYCFRSSARFLGIRLRKCGPDTFVRESPWSLFPIQEFMSRNPPYSRYFLTNIPVPHTKYDTQLLRMDLFITQTRLHALQIKLLPHMYIYDAWPWSRFDNEDQLFFVSSENLDWDCSALRLNICFFRGTGRERAVELECVFFATGWSCEEWRDIQCTLVDYHSYATALSDLQSQILSWNHDTVGVRNQLIHHKIPMTSIITQKIPGSQISATVTFTLELVTDQRICCNPFWRVEFLCETDEIETLRK